MNIQKLEIDSKGLLNIDIMELPPSCVIVICNGKDKNQRTSESREYKIVTHQGKVKRMLTEEGEEF